MASIKNIFQDGKYADSIQHVPLSKITLLKTKESMKGYKETTKLLMFFKSKNALIYQIFHLNLNRVIKF
jgi:hypothetical protein